MDKLKMHTHDLTSENVEKMAALFPNCVTEATDENGKLTRAIDFDQLRQELSGTIVEGPRERYHLDWPGKREAILAANAPIAKTLRPCRDESVDFDTTKNLFIEGDNLDALKLLQETYLGRVKLIYIDPPYNTGSDLIYDDDFVENSELYKLRSNQVDSVGNRLVANTLANGRYHSDWLTMMLPRIQLSRMLLRDDGFICVSIDDAEFPRLREVLDEVFGAGNFLATLVFDRNRKNDARFFSVGHEYMAIYARSMAFLSQSDVILRAPKEGVDEVHALYTKWRSEHGDEWNLIQAKLREFYKSISVDDPRRPLARYNKVDEHGPYRDDKDISWPGGGGPTYEVLHPRTRKPCKIPSRGWVYPNPERFWEEYRLGHIAFGPDETTVPSKRSNMFGGDSQVMSSVSFSYAQTSANQFDRIFDGVRVFDNPKPVNDLAAIVQYLSDGDDLILDFFAGSATTAHAVFIQNAKDDRRRNWILVQIPERVNEEERTGQNAAEFLTAIGRPLTIAEIAKERIRRSSTLVRESNPMFAGDNGFRVLKIDTSNMRDVYYAPDAVAQGDLLAQVDNIKPDRTPEDLLFQVLVDWGIDLALPIATETITGKQVFFVDTNALAACFDAGLTDDMVKEIARRKPLRAVFRDASYGTDSVKINVDQIFKLLSPDTEVRSI